MGTNTVVDATRAALGPVGVFLPFSPTVAYHVDVQRDAARRLERAGYPAMWTNEAVGGKDALVQLAILLAATDRMVFGTSIANIWARAPQTAHGAAALLTEAHPGRFVLGLGVGYPEQAESIGREFGSPLATMRDYVDRMSAPTQFAAPDVTYPLIVAANGPKMTALAGEITDGAMPAMLPPEGTAQARQLLGPDKLLVVGLAVVPDSDHERAKAVVRETVAARLGRPSAYRTSITRLGYSEQEIAEPSDRLVDAISAYGDPAAIAAKVAEHTAAGADHVVIMTVSGDFDTRVAQLEQLAPALVNVA
jgi:probable F420-dependent oxidoreductase